MRLEVLRIPALGQSAVVSPTASSLSISTGASKLSLVVGCSGLVLDGTSPATDPSKSSLLLMP
jgi:hypothetical protein